MVVKISVVIYTIVVLFLVIKNIRETVEFLGYKKEFIKYLYSIGDTETLHLLHTDEPISGMNTLDYFRLNEKAEKANDEQYRNYLLDIDDLNGLRAKSFFSVIGLTILLTILLWV
jgi:hypothetical protein